jgi:hypothetical protein
MSCRVVCRGQLLVVATSDFAVRIIIDLFAFGDSFFAAIVLYRLLTTSRASSTSNNA